MYKISNRNYSEVVEMLNAYISTEHDGADLRTRNRYRRARLLVKSLLKRCKI